MRKRNRKSFATILLIGSFAVLATSFIVRGLEARGRGEIVPDREKSGWMYPGQAITLGVGFAVVAAYGIHLIRNESKK
jgi:hypothetical protein